MAPLCAVFASNSLSATSSDGLQSVWRWNLTRGRRRWRICRRGSLFTRLIKVLQVQIDIFDFAVEFSGDVVAHPPRGSGLVPDRIWRWMKVPRDLDIFARPGQEAVCVHAGRGAVAGEMQHGGPEQGVEIEDVFKPMKWYISVWLSALKYSSKSMPMRSHRFFKRPM